MNNNFSKLRSNFFEKIYLYALIVLTFLSYFFEELNLFLIYFLIPFLFIYCVIRYVKIFLNIYVFLFLLLLIWSILSALIVGIDTASSIKVLRSILLTYFFGFQVVALSQNSSSNLKLFYLLIFWFFLGSLYLVFIRYDLASANVFETGFRDSLEAYENVNANRFGYFLLFFTFIAFIYGEKNINNKNSIFFRIIFNFSILFVIVMALYTGSRQIIILNIPLYLILLLIRYRKYFSGKIVGFLIFVIALLVIGSSLKSIIEKSEVGSRIESEELETDARTLVSALAISYGMENPLFGIAPGHVEYRLEMISHNSFTEIFAETGFIGLMIYLAILLYGLYVQIYRFKKTRDYIFVYFAVFVFFYIIDNNFYVFYSWYLLFAIFFLVVTHSDYYYRKIYLK